jgi:integrase
MLDPLGKQTDHNFAKSVARAQSQKIYYDVPCPRTRERAVAGFGLRVTRAGARSFILNYRNRAGRERRYTIGQFPGLSVVAARKRAGELKAAIREGADPLQVLEEERKAPTVADLCERFEAEHLPKKRASTAKDYRAIIERAVLPAWRHRKVSEIGFEDVDALHRHITKGRAAPYQANRTVAVVSKMFNLAIRLGWCTQNPVKGLERNAETKRRRYLKAPELTALLAALAERDEVAGAKGRQSDRPANIIRLLLLTGCRSGELLSATWGQFSLRDGTWIKPASNTKQKIEHSIPLSAPARQLIAEMRTRLDKPPADSELLFPARADARQSSLKNVWVKIVEHATVLYFASRPDEADGKLVADLAGSLGRNPTMREVEEAAQAVDVELPTGLRNLRIHDLRHSYASFLASAGLSLPTIGALLGHSQPVTTARYAHLLDDPLRQATEKVGDIVAGASKPSADVISIKGAV